MANSIAHEPVELIMAGRRPETDTDAVLDVFRDRDDRAEPLTADEVDEQMDCSKRTTLRRLNELAEEGTLESKETGSRAKVWWIPMPADETAGESTATAMVTADGDENNNGDE